MSIEWEAYPPTLSWTGKENGETVIHIQLSPSGKPFAFEGYAEVWIRGHGAQFYTGGDDTETLKQSLLDFREKFGAMMEPAHE